MKKIVANRISILALFFIALAVFNSSCQDSDGSQYYAPGTPVLESVSPAEASGGTVITVAGTGLGDMQSIVLDKQNVPISFLSTLNTDTHILFTIPDTAIGGNQNIILKNSNGDSLVVPFKVIALPIVSTSFPSDFQAGSTVTINGNNLDDVLNVFIDGTTDEVTVVSKTKKSMVLQMPASAVNSGKLKITNLSGTVVASQVYVNIDKALQVFTDALQNGFESWSWGGAYDPSTEYFITGTKSMKAAFDKGGWGGMQLGNPGSIDASTYRYFAFWAKGADEDYDVQVTINWGPWQTFTIPANTWTYFKYDLITAGWSNLNAVNNVTYQIKGADKTFYFDNIVFIK